MITADYICEGCGEHIHYVKEGDCGGTGYAIVQEDGTEKKVCYDCCAKRDLAYMREHGRIVLYLTEVHDAQFVRTGYTVSNWPGTLTFTVEYSRVGSHNIAGRRQDVWFVDSDCWEWHGVCYGCNTQLCHCRRTKRNFRPQRMRQCA